MTPLTYIKNIYDTSHLHLSPLAFLSRYTSQDGNHNIFFWNFTLNRDGRLILWLNFSHKIKDNRILSFYANVSTKPGWYTYMQVIIFNFKRLYFVSKRHFYCCTIF